MTTPYNPQHNGVVERKNRAIMEAAREMLHDQDLPIHLWAEEARTVVYVQNHTTHRVLENKTPEEVFFSKKPEVSHLRIFGCPVHIHIQERRVYLWDIVKYRRLIEYISQDSIISTSTRT